MIFCIRKYKYSLRHIINRGYIKNVFFIINMYDILFLTKNIRYECLYPLNKKYIAAVYPYNFSPC